MFFRYHYLDFKQGKRCLEKIAERRAELLKLLSAEAKEVLMMGLPYMKHHYCSYADFRCKLWAKTAQDFQYCFPQNWQSLAGSIQPAHTGVAPPIR